MGKLGCAVGADEVVGRAVQAHGRRPNTGVGTGKILPAPKIGEGNERVPVFPVFQVLPVWVGLWGRRRPGAQ